VQQLTPRAVLCLLEYPAFSIRETLRRAVGLVMGPEEPCFLPHKPGGDLPAMRLPCQRPAAGLVDKAAQRIVMEADRHPQPL